jgi:hypothetical protein
MEASSPPPPPGQSVAGADDVQRYLARTQLRAAITDAAQLFAAAVQPASADSFLADYLTAVACGQHVLWRHPACVLGALRAPIARCAPR